MNGAVISCLAALAFCFLLSVYSAWSVLEPWEMGLDYNIITQRINEESWGSGRHYLGVGHKFIRFNSTLITVQFAHSKRTSNTADALRSRTADGLELTLELSFQYKLLPETMYKMYSRFGNEFHNIFIKMAMDLLTSAATKHAARSFFVNRTLIGNMMEATLKSHFVENALVEVPLFQLQAVSLPTEFEAAIRETQVAEQKIKKVQAEQSMKIVEFKTGVIQAQRYVKVQEQSAQAVAESIRLRNMADIQSFNASQLYAAKAFQGILENFGGDTEKLLAYMKVRAVRDHPASNTILGIRDDADRPRRHDRQLLDFNSGDH